MTNISRLRQQIYQHLVMLNKYDDDLEVLRTSDSWWLLGTQGCHLCDDAENMLRLFSKVNLITIATIDIADFNEPLMMQFADHIPVILTPTKQLASPFSIIELQNLF